MNEIKELTSELEKSFKEKGLFDELRKLVNDALEMTDEQVKNLLLAFRSPLVIPSGQVQNVMNRKNEDGTVDERIDVAKLQSEISWCPTAIFHGNVTMGMWRRVVEIEALNRDLADINLSKVMSAIANRVADIPIDVPIPVEEDEVDAEIQKEKVVKAVELAPPTGFTTKTIPDCLRKKVIELHNQGVAWHRIEKELGLKQNRGMTATYIYNKATRAGK